FLVVGDRVVFLLPWRAAVPVRAVRVFRHGVDSTSMALNRRQLLTSLGAGLAGAAVACRETGPDPSTTPSVSAPSRPVRLASGEVDWPAVRDLFSLSREWTHLAAFLLASHPKPV